mmetsp:Transcript_53893/g.115619  ORF Transcript_53893/g.115619 Transcript_53893/m.115619 type:complete len:217 (-) Transcript_53893:1077-1727(-)
MAAARGEPCIRSLVLINGVLRLFLLTQQAHSILVVLLVRCQRLHGLSEKGHSGFIILQSGHKFFMLRVAVFQSLRHHRLLGVNVAVGVSDGGLCLRPPSLQLVDVIAVPIDFLLQICFLLLGLGFHFITVVFCSHILLLLLANRCHHLVNLSKHLLEMPTGLAADLCGQQRHCWVVAGHLLQSIEGTGSNISQLLRHCANLHESARSTAERGLGFR